MKLVSRSSDVEKRKWNLSLHAFIYIKCMFYIFIWNKFIFFLHCTKQARRPVISSSLFGLINGVSAWEISFWTNMSFWGIWACLEIVDKVLFFKVWLVFIFQKENDAQLWKRLKCWISFYIRLRIIWQPLLNVFLSTNISEIALAKYNPREERKKIKNHNKYDFIHRINCWKWQEVELNTWNSINIPWWAIHMHNQPFPGYLFR